MSSFIHLPNNWTGWKPGSVWFRDHVCPVSHTGYWRGAPPCMINLLWVFFWGGVKCYLSFQLPVSSYKQFVMPAVTLLAPVSSVKQPYHRYGFPLPKQLVDLILPCKQLVTSSVFSHISVQEYHHSVLI